MSIFTSRSSASNSQRVSGSDAMAASLSGSESPGGILSTSILDRPGRNGRQAGQAVGDDAKRGSSRSGSSIGMWMRVPEQARCARRTPAPGRRAPCPLAQAAGRWRGRTAARRTRPGSPSSARIRARLVRAARPRQRRRRAGRAETCAPGRVGRDRGLERRDRLRELAGVALRQAERPARETRRRARAPRLSRESGTASAEPPGPCVGPAVDGVGVGRVRLALEAPSGAASSASSKRPLRRPAEGQPRVGVGGARLPLGREPQLALLARRVPAVVVLDDPEREVDVRRNRARSAPRSSAAVRAPARRPPSTGSRRRNPTRRRHRRGPRCAAA